MIIFYVHPRCGIWLLKRDPCIWSTLHCHEDNQNYFLCSTEKPYDGGGDDDFRRAGVFQQDFTVGTLYEFSQSHNTQLKACHSLYSVELWLQRAWAQGDCRNNALFVLDSS